jgi:glycosyltransferase involved in cell wall biosynthesis
MKSDFGISVVLCCHNSVMRITETLAHLARQEMPSNVPWEVVVVDNASTDGTAGVAMREWAASPAATTPLRCVEAPTPGLSFARRVGLETAKYKYVVLCDDDNWLCRSYLAAAFELMTKYTNIGALGGHGKPAFERPPPAWFLDYVRCLACYPQGTCEGPAAPGGTLYGAGLVVRRDLLLKMWRLGMETALTDRRGESLSSGGDLEMCLMLAICGYELWYSPRLVFEHYMPERRYPKRYLRRLRFAMGRANAALIPYKLVALGQDRAWRASWFVQLAGTGRQLAAHMIKGCTAPRSRVEVFYFLGRTFELLRKPTAIRAGLDRVRSWKSSFIKEE